MAQYVPPTWRCSKEASAKLEANYPWVLQLVSKRARRYFSVPGISQKDLIQEGLVAATYGLDSFQEGRGKLKAYLGTLVENALAMVVGEIRAQKRQPYVWEWDREGDKWVKVISRAAAVDPDMCSTDRDAPERLMLAREERLARQKADARSHEKIMAMRATLSDIARDVFDLKYNPPPDLVTLARNMTGRNIGDNARISNRVISQYLGIPVTHADRALKEIKRAIRPDDQTRPRKSA